MSNNKSRIVYLDWIETFAMFAVVFCHDVSTSGGTVLSNILIQLTVIAVPLFFMANGTLMFHGKYDYKKHISKIGKLFLTIVLWKLIYLIVMGINYKNMFSWSAYNIFRYFLGMNLNKPFVPASHFWYLYTLVAIYILFPLFYRVYKSNKKEYMFFVILITVFVVFLTEYNVVSNLVYESTGIRIWSWTALKESIYPIGFSAGKCLVYFLIGPIIHDLFYVEYEIAGKTRLVIVLLIAAFGGLLIYDRYLQFGTLDGEWERLQSDYQRLPILILAILVYTLLLSFNFEKNKLNGLMIFVSKRTMGIYTVHKIISFFIADWCKFNIPTANAGIHTLKTIVVFLMSIGISELISYIPKVNSVLGLGWHVKKKVKQ